MLEGIKKRWWVAGIATVAILCVVGVGINFVTKYTNNYPISAVQVVGHLKHVDPKQVEAIVKPQLRANFFDINIEGVKQDLMANPWVQNVVVSRQWPGKLRITITENKAVAVWNHQELLTAEGNIFEPPQNQWPKKLLMLNGPKNQRAFMLTQVKHFDQLLAPIEMHITGLSQSNGHDWLLSLNNGMEVMLGRELVVQRLERFVRNYPQVKATDPKGFIHYVDLRYNNALAVRWS